MRQNSMNCGAVKLLWITLIHEAAVVIRPNAIIHFVYYRVILLLLDPRKCEYLKDYSLDFEYAYMTTYLAS